MTPRASRGRPRVAPVPADPRRGRRRRLLTGAALATAAVAVAVLILLWSPRATPLQTEVEGPRIPAPSSLDGLPWPAVTPALLPALEGGRRGLAEAIERFRQGQDEEGDAALLAALGALERAGALVPAVAPIHYLSVASGLEHQRLDAAAARAERWLAKFPEDFDHQFVLGKARFGQGRWAAARAAFERASRLRPGWADVLRWLSQTCARQGAQPEGVAAVRASLEAIEFRTGDPWRHPVAPLVLRNALMVLHRFQEFEELERVAALYRGRFPQAGEAVMAQGVALASLGRAAEALPLLREALRSPGATENHDEILFLLGSSAASEGRHGEAASILAGLLLENPYHARAYYQLGLALSRLGRGGEAAAMQVASRTLGRSERELRRENEQRGAGRIGQAAATHALALTLRGELAEAEQWLRSPELKSEPYAVFALGDLYLSFRRVAEAQQVTEQAATLVGPSHADVVGRQAEAALALGNAEEAVAKLRKIASTGIPSHWTLRFGEVLIEQGDLAEAERVLEPAHDAGGDKQASFLLGRCRVLQGDGVRALEAFQRISTSDLRWESWNGDAWLARARVLAGQSLDDAARLLEEASEDARASEPWLEARVLVARRKEEPAAVVEDLARKLAAHRAIARELDAIELKIAHAAWPGSAPLYVEAARASWRQRDRQSAVLWARRALAATPDLLDAHRLLAEVQDRPEDVFFRIRALREVVRLASSDAAARAELARVEAPWKTLAQGSS